MPHPTLLRPTDPQVRPIDCAVKRTDLLAYLAQSVPAPLPDANLADLLVWVQCSQPQAPAHLGCQITLVVHNRRTGEFPLVCDAREADIRRDHLQELLRIHKDHPA